MLYGYVDVKMMDCSICIHIITTTTHHKRHFEKYDVLIFYFVDFILNFMIYSAGLRKETEPYVIVLFSPVFVLLLSPEKGQIQSNNWRHCK